ncbi:MAG: hypothetical protein LIP02_03990 [Bacteroidales bacterium]|nr:hypothetical protein [Bacteroidales bacterium]
MARTKSYEDIERQRLRLWSRVQRGSARESRINEIAERYKRNIDNTKSMKDSIARADKANAEGKDPYDVLLKAEKRQYSQNTYMGINAG